MACNPKRSIQLGQLAGGRLAAETAGELLEHLAGCPPCSQEFDLVADVVRAGVEEGFPRGVPRSPARVIPFRAIGWALAAAAAVVLVMVVLPDESEQRRFLELAQLTPPPAIASVLRSENAEENPHRAQAFELYRSGDYKGAAERFENVVRDDAEDALAAFYLGVAWMQEQGFERAIKALALAAEAGHGLLQERALWYLANAQLATEDARSARETLQRLIALEGDYLLNAVAKVREIDNLTEE